jgi:peroxiredoxin
MLISRPPWSTVIATMRRAFFAGSLLAVCVAGCGPKAAPSFELKTLKGDTVSSASFKGQVTVLFFWASWAQPSRLALAQVNRFARSASRQGVAVVAIAVADDPAAVTRALKGSGVTVRVVLGDEGTVKDYFPGGGDMTLPLAVVLDARGRIVERLSGYQSTEDLGAAVAKAAGEPGGGSATNSSESSSTRRNEHHG